MKTHKYNKDNLMDEVKEMRKFHDTSHVITRRVLLFYCTICDNKETKSVFTTVDLKCVCNQFVVSSQRAADWIHISYSEPVFTLENKI